MRKVKTFLLCMAMLFVLAACTSDPATTGSTPNPSTPTSSTVAHTHEWAEASCTAPKTCKICGEIEGEPLDHVWQEATCTTPKTCNRCKTTEGNALGHNWKAATCTVPKTCSNCGATEGSPVHDYADGRCLFCKKLKPSEGLYFTQVTAGYEVSGIGSCVDTHVVIPDCYNGRPVISIGNSAFESCTSLTSITIPSSVTSIGTDAFSYCTNLTSITIPSSVTSIGTDAFSNSFNLKTVIYKGTLEQWLNISFNKASSNPCYYGATLYINGEVLADVNIPNSVTTIGQYAFYNCASITNAEIPSSVTSIGTYAFSECASLASVTFDEGSKLTSIGDFAFVGCSNLKSVMCKGTLEQWLQISFASEYANPCYYGATLYINGEVLADVNIPNSVTTIGKYAFYKCTSITNVEIPSSVTSIGEQAFISCSSLTSITIPDSVTSIGGAAFCYCTSLTSITIPSSVTRIGNLAFCYCTSLTSITIPSSVTSIGNSAFKSCTSLTSITFEGTVGQWNAITKGSLWKTNVPATEVICNNGKVTL